MIDLSVSGLRQSMAFELLDLSRKSLDELMGVRSFSRRRSIYASPRGGGTLDLTVMQKMNPLDMAVRAWVYLEYGGESEPYPAATMMPRLTGSTRVDAGTRWSMSLLDFTAVLDVPIGKHYSVPKGTLITSRIREILLGVGALDAAITESSETAATDLYWDPLETKRKVVNELGKLIGYAAVWASPLGQLRVEPYSRPSDRPVAPDLGLIHGSTCTRHPEFDVEHDITGVPNTATITVRTVEPLEPVVCRAALPNDHPYSQVNRGGLEVPFTEADVEIAVDSLPANFPEGATPAQITAYRDKLQAGGTAYAQRKLDESASPSKSFSVSHRWRPVELNTVTNFYAPAYGVEPEVNVRVSIVADDMNYDGRTIKASSTIQEVVL